MKDTIAAFADSYPVKVRKVKHVVPSDDTRRLRELQAADPKRRQRQLQAADAFPPKDLISIRPTYTDLGGPDYCDYACVYESMWGTPIQPSYVGYSGNLSRFLHESSFGRLRWPASLGKVVNVNMNKATSVYGNCDGGAIVRDVVAVADAAGHSASGYTHVEIFLPDGIGNPNPDPNPNHSPHPNPNPNPNPITLTLSLSLTLTLTLG